MTGNVVGGVPKDKTVRITDAMENLKLASDGNRVSSNSSG